MASRTGLLHLLGVATTKKGWKDRSVGEIIDVCQEPIPVQAPNEPINQEWT